MLQKVLLGPKLAVCVKKRPNLLISQRLIAAFYKSNVTVCTCL